jgi:hypothetical protein
VSEGNVGNVGREGERVYEKALDSIEKKALDDI